MVPILPMKTLLTFISFLVALSVGAAYVPNSWDTQGVPPLPTPAAVLTNITASVGNTNLAGTTSAGVQVAVPITSISGGTTGANYYWTNLATAVSSTTLTGTTNIGNTAWSVVSGALNFTGGANIFTNYLVFTNEINMSHQWTLSGILYVSSASQVGQGVGFGSINVANFYGGASATSNLLVMYVVGSSFPGGVQAYMAGAAFVVGGTVLTAIGASPTNNFSLPGQNQANRFILQRRGNVYTLSVSNTVTGTHLRFGYTYNMDSLTNGYETSGANSPTIWISGPVTGSISNLVYTDDGWWPSYALLAGDSVISGYGFPNLDDSFSVKLQQADTAVNIDAGMNARILDLSLCAPSANRWHPGILTIQGGENDLDNGTSLATTEAAFAAMVNTYSNYNTLYVLTPTPWNVFNMVPYQWWTLTNYPSSSIDMFGPLSAPNFSGNEGFLIKTNYYSEGVHPNNYGNSVEAHVIQNRWKGTTTQ